ncbi:MAG: hypothetical protein PHQ22_09275 [Sulfuricurvum sp.]|nr:hypothetical protein [Sulfuricurvum sp.]MDD5387369.1 hypothetical protein [Sulfuricurvum sp.]
MKSALIMLFSLMVLSTSVFAASGKDLAKSLKLDPSSKAIKQWEKIFEKPDKMASMGIDKLSDGDQSALKGYLTSHAADSDHPEAAGL